MNKKQLIADAIKQLTADLINNLNAAKSAHNASTDEQSVAETQYDTLAIEAGYLAEGQSKRVTEIQQAIQLLEHTVLINFDKNTPVDISALIQLSKDVKSQHWFFITPSAGGFKTILDNCSVTFITPQSPMGQALLGMYVEDEISIRLGNKHLNCYISSIY